MDANGPIRRDADALTVIGLGRAIEIAVNSTGLTSAQYRALSLIDAGVTSSGILASFMAVRPPTVTTVMSGLVDNDWVQRVRRKADRRRVDYRLTEAGLDVLAHAQREADEALSALVGDLPPEEASVAWEGLRIWRWSLYATADADLSP